MLSSLIITERLAVEDPLAEWRWKVGGAARLVLLTRAGDAFVRQANGHVWWLECGGGSVTEVATSTAAFEAQLDEPEARSQMLLAPVIEASLRRDGPFPPGSCLGFTQLPILGGSYGLENRWRSPAHEHFALTGDVHRQLRDTPDASQVNVRITD
jgi:hypothetical protein